FRQPICKNAPPFSPASHLKATRTLAVRSSNNRNTSSHSKRGPAERSSRWPRFRCLQLLFVVLIIPIGRSATHGRHHRRIGFHLVFVRWNIAREVFHEI